MRMLKSFLAPVRGLRVLVNHPDLVQYMLIPWLVTLVFVIGSMAVFQFMLPDVFTYFWEVPEGEVLWWVHAVVSWMFWVVFSVLAVFIGVLIGQVAAAPAYVSLAKRTREHLTGRLPDQESGFYLDLVQPVIGESIKLLLFLVIQGLLLLLNVLPGAGTFLYVLGSGLTTMFWIALEFFDYVLDTEGGLTAGERMKYVMAHASVTMSFAAGMFLILSIPLINIVLAPMGVLGATLVHVEQVKSVKQG